MTKQFSIIVPCYNTPKMTAYSLAQILEHSPLGSVEVILVNNYLVDAETEKRVNKVIDSVFGANQFVKYVEYPKDKLQSHGISVDWAIENNLVTCDYFMVLESDSFPENNEWIDYYFSIIDKEYDAAYSILKLSGGVYGHPCGALYSKKAWKECSEYVKSIPYSYFPNMNKRQGFDYHIMIHNQWLDKVLKNPDDFFDLSNSYLPYSIDTALQKINYYKPTTCVFHNGMGNLNEEVLNYGTRNFETGLIDVLFDEKSKIIKRVGYEPGQYFSYWLNASGKKVFNIPIEVKWMPNRIGQQQEYTINEAGIRHLWGISSYTERVSDGVEDVFKEKRELPNKLYDSLPESKKVI